MIIFFFLALFETKMLSTGYPEKEICVSISPSGTTDESYRLTIHLNNIIAKKGVRANLEVNSELTQVIEKKGGTLTQDQLEEFKQAMSDLKREKGNFHRPKEVLDDWLFCVRQGSIKKYYNYSDFKKYPPRLRDALLTLIELSPIKVDLHSWS